MSGYIWAKTPEGALFVVLMVNGRGFVPGVENAIDMAEIFILEPVQWPTEVRSERPPCEKQTHLRLAATGP